MILFAPIKTIVFILAACTAIHTFDVTAFMLMQLAVMILIAIVLLTVLYAVGFPPVCYVVDVYVLFPLMAKQTKGAWTEDPRFAPLSDAEKLRCDVVPELIPVELRKVNCGYLRS